MLYVCILSSLISNYVYAQVPDFGFNGTEEELNSWLNTSQEVPSYYETQLVLGSAFVGESGEELSSRLERLTSDARSSAQALHYKLQPPTFTPSHQSSDVLVTLWRRQVDSDGTTTLYFSTDIDGDTIPSEVVVKDVSTLTPQHISAIMRYPFVKISSHRILDEEQNSKWWIVGCIAAVGVAILLCGWIVLFIFYNTCGRFSYTLNSSAMSQKIYIKDEEIQTDETSSPQQPPSTSVRFDQTPRASRRRPPDLSINTETNRGASPEIFKMPEPFSVESVAYEGQNYQDIFEEHKPASEGSWEDDSPSIDIQHEYTAPKRPVRPKTAGTVRPIRDKTGRILSKAPQKRWSHYVAGDQIAAMYQIGPGFATDHPRPLHPTDEGILELQIGSQSVVQFPWKFLEK